jgi:pimeloyl-ACP methyl ester carboxylesterase
MLKSFIHAAITSCAILCASGVYAQTVPNLAAEYAKYDVSDAALIKELPGFRGGSAEVNGVRLNYVEGGKGDLIILLPGWPQTWWAYHKIMPDLAKNYRVVSVDIRGMGASDKPADGYDKRTMAKDISELIKALGADKAHVVGHDIGAQVAYAVAANYPAETATLTLLDVPHPDDGLLAWPMLPKHGTFGDKIDPANPYVWWFAFHQVKGLPEDLLEGRAYIEHEWFFRYLLVKEDALDKRDRAVYAAAYNSRDAIRGGNAWYQAFTQDIIDQRSYPEKLTMPALGIGGPGYGWLNDFLTRRTTNPTVVQFPESGHFIAEEAPTDTTRVLLEFLDKNSH